MKKIILGAFVALISQSLIAQIYTQGVDNSISGSNILIDGSSTFSVEAGAGANVGKGIIIPSVDLVNFEFDLTLADGFTFPTYFDGMVVYNNATGATLTTGDRPSTSTNVAPGFYYFSNPNGNSNGNVTGGEWIRIGGDGENLYTADGQLAGVRVVDLDNNTLSFINGSVGVGANPDLSAKMDVSSTNQGFLPPRMTTTQRNAISNPAAGIILFNTTAKCLQWFDGGFWIDGCGGPPENPSITAANVTYQGTSVINTTGIGYNGEAVPSASTITVELTNASADPQTYGLIATDPTTGLSYTATGTIAGSASGVAVVLNNNGAVMPDFSSGVITMALMGTSSTLNLEPRIDVKSIPTSDPDWTYTDVTYGTQIWMDRNLGARRVATALNDVYSYGNHYQWGRPADGHEISVWKGDDQTVGRGLEDTTSTLATGTPANGDFILATVSPFDWVASPAASGVDTLWATASQGPCPAGYHVPTNAEWVIADTFNGGAATSGGATVGWDNNVETYNSALKLPSAGLRVRIDGLLNLQGTNGAYWSSNVGGTYARNLSFYSTAAHSVTSNRASGFSVRCLKN